jgi:hypothetical protein
MSYYYPKYVRLETAAAVADNVVICFHERMEVVGAKIVDFAGITANNSDYATFQVLGNDQTDVLFEWDTRAANEGALTANTSADMASEGAEDKRIFDAGDALIVKVLKASGGRATNACVCLQLRQARSY